MNSATGKTSAILWATAIVAIVLSIVGVGWWMQKDNLTAAAAHATATQPATVRPDRDYYFFVRLVEFKPTNQKGKSWDSGNSSAPDAEIIMFWRGNRTFSWAEREDQLIATWDLFRVNVKDLIMSGGKVDIASAINAPLVRTGPNETVTLEVWDEDPMMSDLALRIDIVLGELREGRNSIALPPDSGIARLEIDILDRETPLARLIEIQSNGG